MSLSIRNGAVVNTAEIPVVPVDELRAAVIAGCGQGKRLSAFHGRPVDGDRIRLLAILAEDKAGTLSLHAADVSDSYDSLTPQCPQAHWFEREIAEQWGVKPLGHPWLKPIRFHKSHRPGKDAWDRDPSMPILCGVTDYFRMDGLEMHEVAVGPVHAGVIEPGSFRFQCHGEHVFHLEISLGYQHRGVERALVGGPTKRTVPCMETLAGDTTVGHTVAYCRAIEALCGTAVPARAEHLRGIMFELERLANHTGDLGALAGDVAYLPTANHCGRLRGDWLNMTAVLCGSRFGRGMVRPGGVMFDVDETRRADLLQRLDNAERDVTVAVDLLWISGSVLERFENCGTVSHETAQALGLVGPAGRACGCDRDVRRDFAWGVYSALPIGVETAASGDVYARSYIRWLEMKQSMAYLRKLLQTLPAGPIRAACGPLAPAATCVSLVEGWRGEIVHTVVTDSAGKFLHYKVKDPSFHNWMGLAMALRDQPISDFPVNNKSFNLSYCGHDL